MTALVLTGLTALLISVRFVRSGFLSGGHRTSLSPIWVSWWTSQLASGPETNIGGVAGITTEVAAARSEAWYGTASGPVSPSDLATLPCAAMCSAL